MSRMYFNYKVTLLCGIASVLFFPGIREAFAQPTASPRYPSRGLKRISYHTAAETPLMTPAIKNGKVVYSAQTNLPPAGWDVTEQYTSSNEIFYYGSPVLTGPYIYPTGHQITTNGYKDGGESFGPGGHSPVLSSNGTAAWETPNGARIFWGLGTDWPRDGLANRIGMLPPAISGDNALWVENFSDGANDWQTYVAHQITVGTTYEPSVLRTPGVQVQQYSLSGNNVFEVLNNSASGSVTASDVYHWSLSSPNPVRISNLDDGPLINAKWELTSWENQAAWVSGDGTTVSHEVWMYDGATAQQITDNTWPEHEIGIADGRVVWKRMMGYDDSTGAPVYGIEYFDGTAIHNFGRGSSPVISPEGVAWVTEGGGVSYHDIARELTQLIVEDGVNARNLAIDGSAVAFYADNALDEFNQARVVDGQIELETFAKEVYLSSYLGGAFSMAYSSLSGSLLSGVDLGKLDLSYTIFENNDVTATNFAGTDLSGATGLQSTTGGAIYSYLTTLPENFNPQEAGWSYVTPEPSALIVMLLGLVLCPWRTLRRISN